MPQFFCAAPFRKTKYLKFVLCHNFAIFVILDLKHIIMKRISAIILCVLLCASCERHGGNDKDLGNDDNITGAVNSEGFLISYIYPCELDIQRGDADSLKVLIRGDSATDEEKHILMEKYGDTTFNSTLIEPTGAIAIEFTGIEITSDKDFDAGHKAGASLADIAVFHGASAWEYINAGCPDSRTLNVSCPDYWNPMKDFSGPPYYCNGFRRIDKPIGEITENDLILIDSNSIIEFLQQPEQPGTHTITIRFIGEGITIEGDFEMTFE